MPIVSQRVSPLLCADYVSTMFVVSFSKNKICCETKPLRDVCESRREYSNFAHRNCGIWLLLLLSYIGTPLALRALLSFPCGALLPSVRVILFKMDRPYPEVAVYSLAPDHHSRTWQ